MSDKLDEAIDSHLRNEIDNLGARITSYKEDLRRKDELIAEVRNKNTELEVRNRELRASKQDNGASIAQFQNDIRDLEAKNASLRAAAEQVSGENIQLRMNLANQSRSMEDLAKSLSSALKSGTFAALREANNARAVEWEDGADFGMLFYAVAMGGEAGEALNVVKKLERERLGARGSRSSLERLGAELADVIIYADLLAGKVGIDLWEAVYVTFNNVSVRDGLETRL